MNTRLKYGLLALCISSMSALSAFAHDKPKRTEAAIVYDIIDSSNNTLTAHVMGLDTGYGVIKFKLWNLSIPIEKRHPECFYENHVARDASRYFSAWVNQIGSGQILMLENETIDNVYEGDVIINDRSLKNDMLKMKLASEEKVNYCEQHNGYDLLSRIDVIKNNDRLNPSDPNHVPDVGELIRLGVEDKRHMKRANELMNNMADPGSYVEFTAVDMLMPYLRDGRRLIDHNIDTIDMPMTDLVPAKPFDHKGDSARSEKSDNNDSFKSKSKVHIKLKVNKSTDDKQSNNQSDGYNDIVGSSNEKTENKVYKFERVKEVDPKLQEMFDKVWSKENVERAHDTGLLLSPRHIPKE